MDILQSGWWNCVNNKTQIPHKMCMRGVIHCFCGCGGADMPDYSAREKLYNSLLTEQLHVSDSQQSTETMTCPHSVGHGELSLGNDTTTNHHRLCSNKILYHEPFQSSICTSKCYWVTVVRAMLRPLVYASFWFLLTPISQITQMNSLQS